MENKEEKIIREGKASIDSTGTFYNPRMKLCRDMSSTLIATLPDITLADGFSASGIRGIRYMLETKNISHVSFIDTSKRACIQIEKNLKLNKIPKEKADVVQNDFNSAIFGKKFDFIELDPFGTPQPFIYDAIRSLNRTGYLSITATDTAVLCGAHKNKCLKLYNARPIRSGACHEIALRILLGSVAKIAAQFNYGITPLLSVSDQHYLKLFVKLEWGDESAVESYNKIGHCSYCLKCVNTKTGAWPQLVCECGNKMLAGGPLWLSKLHDKTTVEKMIAIAEKRDKENKSKDKDENKIENKPLKKLLSTVSQEIDVPLFFKIDHVYKNTRTNSKPIEEIMLLLRKQGFQASKTHCCPTGIKTDASIGDLRKIFSQQ